MFFRSFFSLSFDISMKNSVQRWSSDFQDLFHVKIWKMALGSNDLSTLLVKVSKVYKSRSLCAISWRLGAASIQGQLTFEDGLHAKSRVCTTRKSGLAHVKWKWNLTLRLSQNYFKCKQTFGMRKAVGFSPTSKTPGCFFRAAASIRVWLKCNLSSEKVSFYSRAASIL